MTTTRQFRNETPLGRLRKRACSALCLLLIGFACTTTTGFAGDAASSKAPASVEIPESVPKPGPAPDVRPPEPAIGKVGELPIWHVERGRVPLVSVQFLLRCGAVNDPVGKEGLASLTASMLDEGAGDLDSVELAKALDRLGATFAVAASHENCTVSLSVLERHLGAALDVFADVLLRPTFDEKEWERVKTLRINDLRQARDRPTHVARHVSAILLYGKDHPYGRPTSGYPETVESISLDDIRAFYKKHWVSAGGVVVTCGNLKLAKLESLLEPRFGAWASSDAPSAAADYQPPKLGDHARPKIAIAHKENAQQTVISIAGPGIPRKDPDYMALSLANIAFGGSFTSRLLQNLRVKHSYTYNARSGFDRRMGQGLFTSSASVRADATIASVAEFQKEYLAVRAGGLNEQELTKARATLRNAVIRTLGTIDSTSGMFVNLARNHLPSDEISRFVHLANTTSMAQVKAAIARIVDWEAATIVLVGDLELIKSQLEGSALAGSGQVVHVDDRGEVISEISFSKN